MKPRFLLLSFLLFTFSFLLEAYATIRYVSKTGSSTAPYTSWATASDSMQKCINTCQSGDTVYVANGVYKEQVVMIPGLSLIGNGMDSCTIDSRDFVSVWNDIALQIMDSCLVSGFKIIVSNDIELGIGIAGSGGESTLVQNNKILSAQTGILIDGTAFDFPNFIVYKNIFSNIKAGIDIFNSSPLIRKNIICNDYSEGRAIIIGAFNDNYRPVIDSNYIEVTSALGIRKSFGSRPIITNNTIKLKPNSTNAVGITLSTSDSATVSNNVVISEDGVFGIDNSGVQYLCLYNNFVTGIFLYYPLTVGFNSLSTNNAIVKANGKIRAWGTQNLEYKYNNVWGNNISYEGFTPDSTNLSVDPMVVRDYGNIDSLDFHLQKFSPMIDAGDPNLLDKNGSRSDIGLYGGPLGEIYAYLDLAPRPPQNLSAVVDSNKITLRWNKNTEADTAYYQVYRDTVQNFNLDSIKLVSSLTDSFFIQSVPKVSSKYVYKITCLDKKGNESIPSEELTINLTSINDYPMTINDYILYQNYPNPFNPNTKIAYRLKEGGYIKLYVYDIKGELIDILVNQNQEGGYYEIDFTTNRKNLASGTYIYQMMVKNENDIPVFTDFRKMILIK